MIKNHLFRYSPFFKAKQVTKSKNMFSLTQIKENRYNDRGYIFIPRNEGLFLCKKIMTLLLLGLDQQELWRVMNCF